MLALPSDFDRTSFGHPFDHPEDPSGAVQIDAEHQATDLENASTADLSTAGFVLGFER